MTAYLIDARDAAAIEILGPTIQFLTPPDGTDESPCVMRGTIPAGVSVGLHAHHDPETFFVLGGDFEAYDGEDWLRLRTRDVFHVPGDVRHGFRNESDQPAETLIVSTARIGRFFREVAGVGPERFAEIAARYGHDLATPEENLAASLELGAP